MTRLVYLLPVLILAGLVAAMSAGLGKDPAKLPSMLIDKPLPRFDLPPVRAGAAGLSDASFRGRPRLLNVFASWCAACRIEHPLLMRLKDEGVEIYGLDWKDRAEDGARWLAQFGDPYARAGNDERGRVGIDLGVTGVPETFVVDGHGRVRYKHIGPITPADWDGTIAPLLQKLEDEA